MEGKGGGVKNVVMTNPHGSYLAIGCWSVSCLSNGEIEEGKQTKDISEESVESVIVGSVVVPYIVKLCY